MIDQGFHLRPLVDAPALRVWLRYITADPARGLVLSQPSRQAPPPPPPPPPPPTTTTWLGSSSSASASAYLWSSVSSIWTLVTYTPSSTTTLPDYRPARRPVRKWSDLHAPRAGRVVLTMIRQPTVSPLRAGDGDGSGA